jgi:hypothetical protein
MTIKMGRDMALCKKRPGIVADCIDPRMHSRSRVQLSGKRRLCRILSQHRRRD